MRRLLFVIASLLVLWAPGVATAQDADRETRLALAERAFAAMQGDQMSDMIHQMSMAFPPPEFGSMSGREQIAYEEVMAETTQSLMRQVMSGATEIYTDTYTREELEAMVAFYESPVGQSIIAKSYTTAPQMIELLRGLMPQMMRDVINGMCDRLDCTPEQRAQGIREALAGLGMTAS